MVKPDVSVSGVKLNPQFKKLGWFYKWLCLQPFGIGTYDLPKYVEGMNESEIDELITSRKEIRDHNRNLRYSRARELDPELAQTLKGIYAGFPSGVLRKRIPKKPDKPVFERMGRHLPEEAKTRIKTVRQRVKHQARKNLREWKAEMKSYRTNRLKYLLRAIGNVGTFLDGAHNSRLKRAHQLEKDTRGLIRKYLDTVFEGDPILCLDFECFFSLHHLKEKRNRIKRYAKLWMRHRENLKILRRAFEPFLQPNEKILPHRDVIARLYMQAVEEGIGFKEQKRKGRPLDLNPVWVEAI